MENSLKISVIIPVYNGDKFLYEALESIERQTCQPWEIVIGDNASTDRTLEIAQEFAKLRKNVKLLKQEVNIGFARNINSLVSTASGNFIFILCHDDLINERYIESIREALIKENPDLLISDFYEIDANGTVSDTTHLDNWRNFIFRGDITCFKPEDLLPEIIQRNGFPFTITSVIKRDLFLKVGGYSSEFKTINDSEFHIRYILRAANKICYLNKKIFIYRRHPDMMTTNSVKIEILQDEGIYLIVEHLKELMKFAKENKLYFAIRYYRAAIKRITKATVKQQYPTGVYWNIFFNSIARVMLGQNRIKT